MPDNDVHKSRILCIDDEPDHAQVMSEALDRLGHRTELAYDLAEALERLGKKSFDVIVTDLVMNGKREGLEVLKFARTLSPPPPVILVTAHGDVPTAVSAMNEGAYGFIEKPLDLSYFRAQVNKAAEKAALQKQNQVLEEQVVEQGAFEGIIGGSASMQHIIKTARTVAMSDIPVLITGESGTGKELIARAIHNSSKRRQRRLVPLNCAGLSESILEDELFGHIKGAFTGAQTERAGRFEHADRGTLFMDEIGDMPQSMQAKLLRVLENGEVVRLGSNEPIQVDVRLISATNRELDELVADRRFREDLYFRIKGVSIHLPPLRERREDIPLLTFYFLQQACRRMGKEIDGMEPQTQQVMIGYHWPGNVRQLKHVVENMVVFETGKLLSPDNLPVEIKQTGVRDLSVSSLGGMSKKQVEIELIKSTLKKTEGNRSEAAKLLGMGERTLYRKLKDYGIE